MVNWEFFKPRNLCVIAVIAAVAFFIFNHFSASKGTAQ